MENGNGRSLELHTAWLLSLYDSPLCNSFISKYKGLSQLKYLRSNLSYFKLTNYSFLICSIHSVLSFLINFRFRASIIYVQIYAFKNIWIIKYTAQRVIAPVKKNPGIFWICLIQQMNHLGMMSHKLENKLYPSSRL